MSHSLVHALPMLITPCIVFLIVSLLSMPLKTFQGLYLIAGASLLLLQLFVATQASLIAIIAALCIGEVLHFLLLGWRGSSLSYSNYQALLAFVGLSPWWIGFKFSVIYFITAAIITLLYMYGKFMFARSKAPVRVKNLRDAKNNLSEEDYNAFKSRGSVIFSTPLLITLILVATLYLS